MFDLARFNRLHQPVGGLESRAGRHGLVFPCRLILAQGAFILATIAAGCAGAPKNRPVRITSPPPLPPAPTVQLGVDVLEQQDFGVLKGKRIGLLTHPAGVNRFGLSTIEVLRRDRRLNLVALFGVEHGIHGDLPASRNYEDHMDGRTGLTVHSLYSGRTRKATPEQLASIDVLVIDLQDIGSRSYTFVSAMRYQIEACFENGVEVVVLDRPNPLGGRKVSGPMIDREWLQNNYVGAFPVPYVHGLTIGELARMAVSEPGILQVPDEIRQRGRLTVVPMGGWRRDMTWPDTGLPWVPTSPNVPDFDTVMGYPMTGLGAQLGGFQHGIGTPHPFRLLYHPAVSQDELAGELSRRRISGLRFEPRNVTARNGSTIAGVYVEVVDWTAWRPTELSLHMMQLACVFAAPQNPFSQASERDANLFNRHLGSNAWWNAITRDGARVDLSKFIADWEQQARAFHQASRRYWMYP